MRRTKKREVRDLARTRIERLWKLTETNASERPRLAREWMMNARRIAQKARISLPREISRQICKQCGTILISGRTSRVRVRGNRTTHVSITCLECGAVRRYYVR